jgi:multiple sugar transport system permease protein
MVNTLVYLLFGVNLKLLLALLLSGFFIRKGWWTKVLLLVFMLPWAMPALSSYLSINWMLNGQWGLINNFIWQVAHVDGPPWLDNSAFALGSVIYGHIWKWMPFWTLIFLAGRMAVPVELYEAADVDGASPLQKFTHVTLPLMAGMYLVCTMLSTIWALGDFNAVRFHLRRRAGAVDPCARDPGDSATHSNWAIPNSAWRRCYRSALADSRWRSC